MKVLPRKIIGCPACNNEVASHILSDLLDWCREEWDAQVKHRPDCNQYKRTLDHIWATEVPNKIKEMLNVVYRVSVCEGAAENSSPSGHPTQEMQN